MIPLMRIKSEQNYSNALGEEIVELIECSKNGQLLYREVIDLLGDHDSIKLKIDELLFTNKILKIPLEMGGNIKDFILIIPRKVIIGWTTMVCPCFICQRIDECAVNNPVNPVTCKSFNEWLKEEDNGSSIKDFEYEVFEINEENEKVVKVFK